MKDTSLMLVLFATFLLSGSVLASSFVPGTSTPVALRLASITNKHYYNQSQQHIRSSIQALRGGEDVNDEEAPPPPPTTTTAAAAASSYQESVPEVMSSSPPTVPTPVSDASTAATTTEASSPKSSSPGFLRTHLSSLPWHNLPNALTYARCLAIPLFMGLFYSTNLVNGHIFTAVLFALASLTDWLDGYLARRWEVSSAFGAFLDPVADKLMVSSSLIVLTGRYGMKVAIPTAIILAREIAVSALREWMAQRGQRDAVKVGIQGKIKTALTMLALTVLLLVPANVEGGDFFAKLLQPGLMMLYASTVVTITSGSVYFMAAAPVLFGKEES